MIRLDQGITIRDDELAFLFSRSSGPGGQNVNKVSTRVTVVLDVARCAGLNAAHRQRIRQRLGGRIDKHGCLRVACQRFRTQQANRQGALGRLAELLNEALRREKVRRRTTVPQAAVARRLEHKRRRSRIKQQRSDPVQTE